MRRSFITSLFLLVILFSLFVGSSYGQQEGFIGEVKMFAGNFAPRGWAFCEGQMMQISKYQSLYAILGTTYGGDGRTTFALPDLRGRVAIHPGTGPSLSTKRLGQQGGAETVTLNTSQLPNHSHQFKTTTDQANSKNPTNATLATSKTEIYSNNTASINMQDVIGKTGGNQPHENMPPYTSINFIICLQGIFPSRN
jgi:microcystin-dependent protein